MADIRATTTQGKKPAAAKRAPKKAVAPVSTKAAAAPTSTKAAAAPAARKTIGKKTTPRAQVDTKSMVTAEERQKMIAEAAYLRAESRGFAGGDPTDDWLAAEWEIDQILSRT